MGFSGEDELFDEEEFLASQGQGWGYDMGPADPYDPYSEVEEQDAYQSYSEPNYQPDPWQAPSYQEPSYPSYQAPDYSYSEPSYGGGWGSSVADEVDNSAFDEAWAQYNAPRNDYQDFGSYDFGDDEEDEEDLDNFLNFANTGFDLIGKTRDALQDIDQQAWWRDQSASDEELEEEAIRRSGGLATEDYQPNWADILRQQSGLEGAQTGFAHGFDVPYVSDFMRDYGQPFMGSLGAVAGQVTDPLDLTGRYTRMNPAIPDFDAGDAGRAIGEAFTPVTGEEFLLESIPGAGMIPDAFKAARGAVRAGGNLADEAVGAVQRGLDLPQTYYRGVAADDIARTWEGGIPSGLALTPDRGLAQDYATRWDGEVIPFRARPSQLQPNSYYFTNKEPMMPDIPGQFSGFREALTQGETGAFRIPGRGTPPLPVYGPQERTAQIVANELADAVKTARRLTPEQRALRSQELSRRVGGFANVLEGAQTQEQAMRARGMLRGDMPNVSFAPPEIARADADNLFREVAVSNKLPPLSKNGAIDALADLLAGVIPQPAALEQLAKVYPELAQAVASKRAMGQKLWQEVVGILGVPQTLQTFADASGTLRQALVPGLGNPQDFWKAIKREAAILGAKPGQAGRALEETMEELRKSPWISGAGDKAGYSFEEVGGHLYSTSRFAEAGSRAGAFTGINESVAARISQAVPGVARSQEGMVGILNELGGRIYMREAQNLWDAGVRDIGQYQALARVLNHGRGYGSFRAPDLVKGVNAFFSPRYLSSRVELFTDPFVEFAKGNTAAGKLASKNLVSFVGTNVAVLELLNQTGLVDVSWNPLDTDFGKAKVGNIRIDPWAGASPLARLVSRLGAMALKEVGTDVGYRPPQGAVLELVTDFLGGKLGPVPGFLADASGLRDRFPDAPPLLSLEQAFRSFTPFLVQSIRESLEEGGLGWKGALLAAPVSFLGTTTLAYQTAADVRDTVAQEQFGKPYRELTAAERLSVDGDARIQDVQSPEAKAEAERRATFEARAQELDARGLTGREARDAYDKLVTELALTRPPFDGEQRPYNELTDPEKAQRDYYAIFDQPGVRDTATGGLNFEAYNKALAEWQAKWPVYSKSDVSPDRPLSPAHAKLMAARDRLTDAGFWDAHDQAFLSYRENVTKKSQPDPIESGVGRFETYAEFEAFVKKEASVDFDRYVATLPPDQRTVALNQKDFRVDQMVEKWFRDHRLYEAIAFFKNQTIESNPALMDDLREWYPDSVTEYLLETEQEVGTR